MHKKFWSKNLKENRPLWRHTHRVEANIKTIVKEQDTALCYRFLWLRVETSDICHTGRENSTTARKLIPCQERHSGTELVANGINSINSKIANVNRSKNKQTQHEIWRFDGSTCSEYGLPECDVLVTVTLKKLKMFDVASNQLNTEEVTIKRV
jgi:hypothetical protein